MITFIEIVRQAVSELWPCYTSDVNIVNFPPQFQQIGASGTCPHCKAVSLFVPVGGACSIAMGTTHDICNAVQCQACKKFALVVGRRMSTSGDHNYGLVDFYPAGSPNDAVDSNVPSGIAEDLREALRCRWVKAYRAAVVMCRRAIQSACVDKEMADAKLQNQIDEMATKGLITEPLKQWAHEVRLGGNDGAHPYKDGLKDVIEQDADEIIQFTGEFLHHIYVMPAALAARQASRAAPKPKTA
jgi:hypothetical protein